jgi:hypothetical protein
MSTAFWLLAILFGAGCIVWGAKNSPITSLPLVGVLA